jgi:hypothetical protein
LPAHLTVLGGSSLYLTVCAFRHVPFVLGWLKFNFAMLEVFHIVNVHIVWGGFEFYEEHEKWIFGSILFDVPNI